MTREEIIRAYKMQLPVIFKFDEEISFRYRRIHGYEVRRGDKGEEFKVILLDEEPRKRLIYALPEKVFLE